MLYVFCIVVLPVGRLFFEGHAYNVSLASKYGGMALIFCILIGTVVLRGQSSIPGWFGSGSFQIALAMICVIAGVVSNNYLNAKEVMDIYHNMFVLPLLAYLILSTVPVVFKYGTARDKKAAVAFIVIWAAFGLYDIATGRLDQPKWLADHGHWSKK